MGRLSQPTLDRNILICEEKQKSQKTAKRVIEVAMEKL